MTYKAEAPPKAVDQPGFRPKRFWTAASVFHGQNGCEIHLDGRPVKTPKGDILRLPTQALTHLVAAEWAAVTGHVAFEAMPLTRLGFTAIDRAVELPDETVGEILRYGETDLLCYPSEYPEALTARENAAWLPLLQWAKDDLGLIFTQNKTLIHAPQPPATLAALDALVRGMTAYEQAGIMAATPLFGSVILALALWRTHLTGEAAFAASRIGEDFQAQTWGRDEDAARRSDDHRAHAISLQSWFSALA